MKKLLLLTTFILILFISCKKDNIKINNDVTLYYNGNIITLEDELYANAIEISNGIISKVYYNDEEFSNILKEKKINIIDLKGKTLMPSFIDSHSHLINFAKSLSTVNLTGSTNILEIETKLSNYIVKSKLNLDAWVIGFGYDNNLLPNKKNPTRDDLDKISTTHPILITHASGHVGSMNSKALEYFGVDENTPDIAGGFIERYPDSRKPTGYMEENAYFNYVHKLNFKLSDEDLMNFINQAEDVYLSYGITTAQEALISIPDFSIIKNMITNHRFNIDVIGFVDLKTSSSLLKKNKELVGNYSNRFKINGYKIFLDGSPQAKTAWLLEPYKTGDANYRGYPIYRDSDVVNFINMALDDNVQLQAHCNGDAAANQYLSAFDIVNTQRGITNNYRAVLIHSQISTEEEYARMKRLNIIPSLFVAHVYYWGDTHIENLGMERASEISASYTALTNDLKFTYHQDSPVINPNMLETIWVAVNRVTKNGVLLGENQKVTVLDAIKAVTINAAYQNGEENIKGSLIEGKLADLLILDKNPLEVAPMKIKDIKILETIKEGKTLYKNDSI